MENRNWKMEGHLTVTISSAVASSAAPKMENRNWKLKDR
jgi:hypothetical protein